MAVHSQAVLGCESAPCPGATTGPGAAATWLAWADRWSATAALIVGVAVLRLVYLAFFSPYALIEDEAHYWEWSRHLDWSYYSKGPGIAWAIAGGTALVGDTELGVRLPAVLLAALGALGVAGLAWDVARDRRCAFVAAACWFLSPLFQISALLGTIDMPYASCWALGAWAGWRALERRSRWGWIALGLALGAGFLFKYTMLLLLPGLVLYALVRRHRLAVCRAWGIWAAVGLLVMLLGFVPVVLWNARNAWPTVHHLLGQIGAVGGDVARAADSTYSPLWTLEYLGMQIGLIGPALLLAIYGVVVASRNRDRPTWPGVQFMALCAVPILIFYLLVSFVTRVEGNWTMGGYATLLALCGVVVPEAMSDYRARIERWKANPDRPRPRQGLFRRQPETHRQVAWHMTLGFGLVVGIASLRLDLIARVPFVGGVIPIGRLTSARPVAEDVAELKRVLRDRTDQEPFVIAQHYGRASQLAFYLPGRPIVYCSSSLMHGRRTQFDYWAQTDLGNLARLGGRPAVLVGSPAPKWAPAFARVEPIGPLVHDHKKGRFVSFGYAYRGFPKTGEERAGEDHAGEEPRGVGP